MPAIARRGFRPREVAEMLGVHEDTVRTWVKDGDLPSIKIGRSVFVPADVVNKMLPDPAADHALSA